MWACRIRPLGAEIVIGCDDALASALEEHVSPWQPASCRTRPGAILLAASGERPFTLRAGSRVLHTSRTLDGLMAGLQHWLDGEVIRAATGLVAVHAGAVGWKGGVILLPGASGAGKTTLVTALVARGTSYYSDELAFIDVDGSVHAYPRRAIVRDASGVGYPRALGLASAEPVRPAPVSLIAGLRFADDAGWQVARVPASEALMLLLANTAHRLSRDGVPPALLRAAASACSYAGRRGEAAAASAEILALVDAPRRC